MNNESLRGRRIALILTIIILFAVLAGDLVKLQVFETQAYKDIVSNVSSRISPTGIGSFWTT